MNNMFLMTVLEYQARQEKERKGKERKGKEGKGKERKGKEMKLDYAFRRHFNEKPSIIPGCPDHR